MKEEMIKRVEDLQYDLYEFLNEIGMSEEDKIDIESSIVYMEELLVILKK